eukprot:6190631-Pleurochrysis_carterae.AAC.1
MHDGAPRTAHHTARACARCRAHHARAPARAPRERARRGSLVWARRAETSAAARVERERRARDSDGLGDRRR